MVSNCYTMLFLQILVKILPLKKNNKSLFPDDLSSKASVKTSNKSTHILPRIVLRYNINLCHIFVAGHQDFEPNVFPKKIVQFLSALEISVGILAIVIQVKKM